MVGGVDMMGKMLIEQIQGQEIEKDSNLYEKIHQVKGENVRLVMELNIGYKTQEEVHRYLECITDSPIDPTTHVSLPFFTDFGKHITLGKRVFINQQVMFVDLGGITIEDDVLIGPMSRLITVNHIQKVEKRRGLIVKSILLKKNAWIGANVTILPGVTIGENSIVAADSTVTKDVEPNVVVAGSPAKIVKRLTIDE